MLAINFFSKTAFFYFDVSWKKMRWVSHDASFPLQSLNWSVEMWTLLHNGTPCAACRPFSRSSRAPLLTFIWRTPLCLVGGVEGFLCTSSWLTATFSIWAATHGARCQQCWVNGQWGFLRVPCYFSPADFAVSRQGLREYKSTVDSSEQGEV